MVSVEEASRIVFSNLFSPSIEKVSFRNAQGRTLAEDVIADRAFPPFNRVSMDGIAIAFDMWKNGSRIFSIEGIQAAGRPQGSLLSNENCLEVMTGAVLPHGTDTVIRYEDVKISNGQASVTVDTILKGQNVHFKGTDASDSEVLLAKNFPLSSAEIALLASVGKTEILVQSLPRVALVSSGDELVDVHETPEPHQIRRSNTYALESALQQNGCDVSCFHLPDDLETLDAQIPKMIAEFDVIILSGGVSKGKFDFIPEVMEKAGVKKLFHEVTQRPGKPFWFGRSPAGKVVFALPGNPVSTFMCYYKYVQPWLKRSMGQSVKNNHAVLAVDFSFQPKLTYFLQVRVENVKGILEATPLVGGGSGDFANLKDVTGFLELPRDRTDFKKGEPYPYIAFRQ